MEDYNVFVTQLSAGRYGGISIRLTHPAAYSTNTSLEAIIAGIVAYVAATVELSPVGQALLAAGAVYAAALVEQGLLMTSRLAYVTR